VTNAEKIDFLNSIVTALHESIYAACLAYGIDVEELNIETYNSDEFMLPPEQNLNQLAWLGKNTIDRDMKKLIAVNKKLGELKNA
jgi:hypothetical protein